MTDRVTPPKHAMKQAGFGWAELEIFSDKQSEGIDQVCSSLALSAVVRALSLTPRVRSQRDSTSPQLNMSRVLIMCANKQDNCSDPHTPSEATAGIVHNLAAASGMPIGCIFYQNVRAAGRMRKLHDAGCLATHDQLEINALLNDIIQW